MVLLAVMNLSFKFFFILLLKTPTFLALKLEMIPPAGSPPMYISAPASVYDPFSSSLYLFGGLNQGNQKEVSDIYSYNFLTNKWSQIFPVSDFIPNGLEFNYAWLGNNRVVYIILGMTNYHKVSDVYTFDLKSNIWGKTWLTGDYISPRTFFLPTRFTWNNTDYIAIYGGSDDNGYDTNLFL